MLSSSESASPEHGSRSGSQHLTIGNSWQHGAEMVVSPGGKKTEWAHKRPRRTLLAHLQPVFPCGLMPVKHEMRAVSPPEFTTLTHNDSLLERFLRWPRVCCSRLGATAHLSGQKLLTFQGIYQWGCTYQTPGGSCRRQSWKVQQSIVQTKIRRR